MAKVSCSCSLSLLFTLQRNKNTRATPCTITTSRLRAWLFVEWAAPLFLSQNLHQKISQLKLHKISHLVSKAGLVGWCCTMITLKLLLYAAGKGIGRSLHTLLCGFCYFLESEAVKTSASVYLDVHRSTWSLDCCERWHCAFILSN